MGDEHDKPVNGADDIADAGRVGAKSRSGLAAAITGCPAPRSESMTPSQLADSANAPWTRTIVGFIQSLLPGGATLRLVCPAVDSLSQSVKRVGAMRGLTPGVREWSSSSAPK
jgi:hypothetical protein